MSDATESTAEGLLPALLAVQSEAPTLRKDATNPHFRSKYTPLDTIVETIGPILAKHGLVWMTLPGRDAHGDPALTYRLAHASTGEALEGSMPLLLSKQDAQGQGSAITYARRYAICAVLNLVADDDDDGNGASGGESAGQPRMGGTPATDRQKGAIKRAFTQHGLSTREKCSLLRGAGADLPAMRDEAAAVKAVEDALKGLFKHQASALLDVLKDGALPTGESDVPADPDAFVVPDSPDTGDVFHHENGDTR
jgi:hypothetical protein